MTFEEVQNKLLGGRADSLDEVAAMMEVLVRSQARSGILIALSLNESKRLFGDAPRWAFWAAGAYRLPDEKFAHHRQNVGEMLRAIEAAEPKKFGLFLEIPVSMLDTWALLYNEGVRRDLANPCAPVFHFLKAFPESPSWKREKLRAEIGRFLHPDRDFEEPELGLKFDAIGAALDDAVLSDLVKRENFSGNQAFVMAFNGAKLCSHAVGVILKDHGTLGAEALEEIDRDLDAVHRQLRSLILRKRGTEA